MKEISFTGPLGTGKTIITNYWLSNWANGSDGWLFTNYKPPDIERFGYNLADRLRPIGEKGAIEHAPLDLYFRSARSR